MLVWKTLRPQKHLLKNYPRFCFSQQRQKILKGTPPSEKTQATSSITSLITKALGVGLLTFLSHKVYQSQCQSREDSRFPRNSTSEEIDVPLIVKKTIEYYGKDNIEAAVALTNEAKKLKETGLYAASLQLHEEALQILAKLKGFQSEEVANCIMEISSCYIDMRKVTKGIETMKKAIEIYFNLNQYEKGFDAMENIAILTAVLSDLKGAQQQFENIITLRKEKIGAKDPLLARTYLRMAHFYASQDKKEEVADCLKKVSDVIKANKHSGNSLASFYMEQSNLYKGIGNFEEAINTAQKTIEHLDPKKEARQIALVNKNIASMHSLLRNPKKSIEIFKRSIDQMKSLEGLEIEIADTNRRIGEEYESMEKFEEAFEYWNKAVDVYQKKNKVWAAHGKVKVCSLVLQAKQRSKAIDCFGDAYLWASKEFGPDHKITRALKGHFETCKEGGEIRVFNTNKDK